MEGQLLSHDTQALSSDPPQQVSVWCGHSFHRHLPAPNTNTTSKLVVKCSAANVSTRLDGGSTIPPFTSPATSTATKPGPRATMITTTKPTTTMVYVTYVRWYNIQADGQTQTEAMRCDACSMCTYV